MRDNVLFNLDLIEVLMNLGLGFVHNYLTQGRFTDAVMKFAVSSDLQEEKGHCWEAHPEKGQSCKLDLFSYLVLSKITDTLNIYCFLSLIFTSV